MARRLLWGSLVLAPVAIAARFVFHAGDVALFVLAAAALVPLAWLIGESTEHAAEHTGASVGGFLNASFGNAPELIMALAVNAGLPNVVRGSLRGAWSEHPVRPRHAMIVGGEGELNRRSLFPGPPLPPCFVPRTVDPRGREPRPQTPVACHHPVAIPPARALRRADGLQPSRPRRGAQGQATSGAWSLSRSLVALGMATAVTALAAGPRALARRFADAVAFALFIPRHAAIVASRPPRGAIDRAPR